MCNPRQELSNAFNTITGWVDRGLTGIGKTIEGIAKDPLPTIATVALTAVGVPPYVTALARTAMSGGNMENYVINLATSYIATEAGAAVGDAAFPELGNVAGYGGVGDVAFQPTATQAILKTVISNASAQGAAAVLQGKDLNEVFNSALSGAVGGLINTTLRTELGVDPSKIEGRLISDATKAAVSSILNNQDPALAIGNALSQSVFGTLANTAASGLKSVVSDINKAATEFETTQSEANTLRGEIDTESTRLSGIASILNSESATLNSTQQTLANSYDLLNLSGQIYDWRSNTVHYNPAVNTAYAQRMGLVEGYSEDFGTYYVNPTTNEFVLSLGLHAKDTLEKQANYLNTNIPQFESDVTNFNTKLATFNADKIKLDDKVDTYDGYVTKLFGEDGTGGLNKTIQDLLVDRDKYLGDLDKSITGLSEIAGEEISDVAKEIATEAVNTLDQNFRTSDEVTDAFANNPLFAGYKPDAADIAKFVGEGADADLQGLINNFVDERTLDAAELADIAQKEGLTLTQDDLLALVQQGDEKELTKQFTEQFDKQAVTRDEAKEFFDDIGFEPSDEQLLQFIGKRDESSTFTDIEEFVTGQREADAQKAGFPDYATQQRFDSDIDAYKASQPRADVEPIGAPEVPLTPLTPGLGVEEFFGTKPSTEPFPYTPGEDAEEFEPGDGTVVDTLTGGLGNDLLGGETDEERAAREAREAEEIIYGGTGNDTTAGGAETVEGGAGNDTVAAVEDLEGFPDAATKEQYQGNYGAYQADLARVALEEQEAVRSAEAAAEAEQLDRAKYEDLKDIFPDYETYKFYNGDVYAYRADQQTERERLADKLGFPSVELYDLYQGDIERYQQEEAEYSGFPDYVTYLRYNGDSTAYQDDLASAEGWPDAATRDEFGGSKERYAKHLEDERKLEESGRQYEIQQKQFRDQLAQERGFPDDETYQQFGGDIDAYLATLPPSFPEDTLGGGQDDTYGEWNIVDGGVETIVGGDENDTLVGGDETLVGGDENDTLIGGDDNDSLVGGDETLEGGNGNDTFDEDTLKDILKPGDSDDLEIPDELLDGGNGNDILEPITCPEGFEYDAELGVCMPITEEEPDLDVEQDVEEEVEEEVTPTCPPGFVYDPTTDSCVPVEAEPEVIECEEGYVYDAQLGMCVPESIEPPDPIECEEGYVYDPITQTCVPEVIEPPEPVECEEGYVYDPISKTCVPEIVEPPEPIECEEGYVYDPVSKTCVPEVIEPPEIIECEEGYVYDPVQGICVPEVIEPPPIECEEGYVYDPVQGICVPEVIQVPPVTPVIPQEPQPPRPPPPPPPPPLPQRQDQSMDLFGLLGLLGMMQQSQQQQQPQAPMKQPEPFIPWEQLTSPYQETSLTTDDLIKMLRG